LRWQVNGKKTFWRPVWVASAKALNSLIEFRAFLLQELLPPLTGVSIERPDSPVDPNFWGLSSDPACEDVQVSHMGQASPL
jgi:hypothetical protein